MIKVLQFYEDDVCVIICCSVLILYRLFLVVKLKYHKFPKYDQGLNITPSN